PDTTPTPPPHPPRRDSAPSACAGSAHQTCHDREDTTPPFPPAGSTSHTAAYAPTASTVDTASHPHRKGVACQGYTTPSHRVNHIPHTCSRPAPSVRAAWPAKSFSAGRTG